MLQTTTDSSGNYFPEEFDFRDFIVQYEWAGVKIHFLRHCKVVVVSSFNKYLLSTSFATAAILGAQGVEVNKADKFLPIVMLPFWYKGDQINKLDAQYHSHN